MHYFIDGYNLMFRQGITVESLQSERKKLIQDLYEKIGLVGLDATIVFDSQYQAGMGSRAHLDSLEICFTDEGETADDYIINELASIPNPREEIVVTSDNQLAWHARRMGAKTEPVESFLRWLDHRFRKKRKERAKEGGTAKSSKEVIPDALMESIGSIKKESLSGIGDGKGRAGSADDLEYLKKFEKRAEQFESKRKRERKGSGDGKSVEEGKRGSESEMSRWQRLFEKRLEEGDREED